jgi:hypothetical protein
MVTKEELQKEQDRHFARGAFHFLLRGERGSDYLACIKNDDFLMDVDRIAMQLASLARQEFRSRQLLKGQRDEHGD